MRIRTHDLYSISKLFLLQLRVEVLSDYCNKWWSTPSVSARAVCAWFVAKRVMLNEILRESLGFVLSALIPSKLHIASCHSDDRQWTHYRSRFKEFQQAIVKNTVIFGLWTPLSINNLFISGIIFLYYQNIEVFNYLQFVEINTSDAYWNIHGSHLSHCTYRLK